MAAKVDTRAGDKVRVLAGLHAGLRAVVSDVRAQAIVARLEESNRSVSLQQDEIKNFSAAARKAWKTMPTRRVGRPAGKGPTRTSVTLRIEKTLWSRFQDLEAKGYIQDRSEIIEELLTKKLDLIERAK